ncbi:MAG: sensor histidine kinase [Lachnospiraceae bacterium]|nr:sensor histidine kinase [Lachnospiraceae bacterium]
MRVRKDKKGLTMPLASVMNLFVIGMVLAALAGGMVVFVSVFRRSVEQNAVISSEQAVVQASNTVRNYTADMEEIMDLIEESYGREKEERDNALETLLRIRKDVIAVTSYDEEGNMVDWWTGNYRLKEKILKNLSFIQRETGREDRLLISEPHAETLLENYYPWVVSIRKDLETGDGKKHAVVLDVRFSQIANYVDEVGIGQHGYCFIMDKKGNIVYHPQQQLIYSGLKSEQTDILTKAGDGTLVKKNVIYSIRSLDNCDWRIVGVSYIDELVTVKVRGAMQILLVMIAFVLVTVFLSSFLLTHMISHPIQSLVKAMKDFEADAEEFSYQPVHGSKEMIALSDSFGHMVGRIQDLMEKVRREEITLRKTELKALQAQINPHFLYNTLDAIGWMCEEERSKDAVEMVNALARLFRISISKGHELIPIGKEVEHARSYLMIQNFRYKNQFTYSFDIEEECLPYLCNKITLQPIIENAIYHGINRMVDEGEIRIRIYGEGDDIVFSVSDNGVGMSKEQCGSILKSEPGDQTGIGIKNVNDRIKIYFGEEYGITIESEPDEGTCVSIRMPKVEEGGYESK